MLNTILTDTHFNSLLTYLPVVCIGAAVIPLGLGLLWRSRRILVGGLVTLAVVAVAAPLLAHGFERDDHHESGLYEHPDGNQTVTAETAERLHELEEAAEAVAMRDATILALAFAGLIAVGLALSSALADPASATSSPADTLHDAASD